MVVRRIGQILVDLGFITDEQLEVILDEQQQRPGALLGKIAEDMGLITDEQWPKLWPSSWACRRFSWPTSRCRRTCWRRSPRPWLRCTASFRFKFDGNTLTVATCDPQNLTVQDELRTFLGFRHSGWWSPPSARFWRAIDKYYSSDLDSVEKIIAELNEDEELFQAASRA